MKNIILTFKKSVARKTIHNAIVSFLAPLVFIICTVPCFAQLELLKDINVDEDPSHNEYSWLTNAGNYMYFVSNNELWKSNGTTQYTMKVKAFTSISNLTMAGSTLYFLADDGMTGPELWKSNGSASSTVRVKDIVPGADGSSPSQFTYINGVVLFTAYSEGKGVELWKTNGTSAGTIMVKDISRGSANPKYLTNLNGILYFSAYSATGYELWRTDGTAANTVLVKDIYPGTRNSNPKFLTVLNNTLFFSAYHPDTGTELWKTNGTTGGTQLLKDIRPGKLSSGPKNLLVANGKLMFTARDGVHGHELWASSGTSAGTVLVKDMNPGGVGSNNTDPARSPMGHFTNINGLLFFIASKGTQDFIYRSDGTDAGTIALTEASGVWNSFESTLGEPQPAFTFRNGYVYFFNSSGPYFHALNLYKMPYKGTAMTLVRAFYIPEDLTWSPYMPVRIEMIRMGGAVYFPARSTEHVEETFAGYDLMRSDGTPEGTIPVHDTFIPTSFSRPNSMINNNGRVYFLTAAHLSYTPELYSTDGTPEGTVQLRPYRYHFEWEPVGNDLFFVEEGSPDTVSTWQLSKTRGRPESTHVVISGTNHEGPTLPLGLTNIKGILYYYNGLGEVWKSNGTAEGTVRVRKLYRVYSITEVNGQAFILAGNENNTLQLWKTTSSGLVFVKTFANSTGITGTEHTTISIGGILYFFAKEGNSFQIFRSNGTAQGSYRMFGPGGFKEGIDTRDMGFGILIEYKKQLYFTNRNALFAVSGNSYAKVSAMPPMGKFIEFNDKLFLFGSEPNFEVYVSDGTSDGTLLLIRRTDGQTTSSFATIGNYLYVNSFWHAEVWRTDGTICGTGIVDVGTESVMSVGALGDDLVFGGYKLATGIEPYIYHNVNSIPGPVCEDAITLSARDGESKIHDAIVTAYPNPFTESFTLKVSGNDGEKAQVAVYTGSGIPVETFDDLAANGEQSNIGIAWLKGFYILKVKAGQKVETYHLIKK